MAFQSILLPPGIQRNATPYDTPNRWWDLNLVRFQSGTLRPIGGWELKTASPLDSNARLLHMWRNNSNTRQILVGTDNKLYYNNGVSYSDITPDNLRGIASLGSYAGYGEGRYGKDDTDPSNPDYKPSYGRHRAFKSKLYSPLAFWSMANWGEDIILNVSTDGFLYYYTSSTPNVKPVKIATAPAGNTAVIVTNERHVMAIGASGASAGGSDRATQRRVAWSSRENYSDWNFASVTNTAGYLDLDARTPLKKGVNVREGVLIFSDSEAYLATYRGLPYIYGIDRIADTTLISPTSVVAYNGKAAWMGKNGFWRYEGGYLVPLQCPVTNDIFVNINQTEAPRKAHAVHNGTFPEIWFFYPTTGNTECNRVVIWNYMEDCWYWSELSRTAGVSGETYPRPIMGGSNGNIYEHEIGWTDAGASRNVYAETGVLPLTDGDRGVYVSQVLPANGHGYGSMKVEFLTRQTPEGDERTFGPYQARTDGYMDTRVNGRDIRMRIEAVNNDEWSIGKFRFNVQPGTGR